MRDACSPCMVEGQLPSGVLIGHGAVDHVLQSNSVHLQDPAIRGKRANVGGLAPCARVQYILDEVHVGWRVMGSGCMYIRHVKANAKADYATPNSLRHGESDLCVPE